jgi:hypothetical protein
VQPVRKALQAHSEDLLEPQEPLVLKDCKGLPVLRERVVRQVVELKDRLVSLAPQALKAQRALGVLRALKALKDLLELLEPQVLKVSMVSLEPLVLRDRKEQPVFRGFLELLVPVRSLSLTVNFLQQIRVHLSI